MRNGRQSSRFRTMSVEEAAERFRQTGGATIVCSSNNSLRWVEGWLEKVKLYTSQQPGRKRSVNRTFEIHVVVGSNETAASLANRIYYNGSSPVLLVRGKEVKILQ